MHRCWDLNKNKAFTNLYFFIFHWLFLAETLPHPLHLAKSHPLFLPSFLIKTSISLNPAYALQKNGDWGLKTVSSQASYSSPKTAASIVVILRSDPITCDSSILQNCSQAAPFSFQNTLFLEFLRFWRTWQSVRIKIRS